MAKAPRPASSGAEIIPDVEPNSTADSGEVNELTGLTAEEQAQFDQMRTGEEPADPAEPEPGDGDADPADPDGDPADPADPAEPVDPADPTDPDADPAEPGDGEPREPGAKRPTPKTVSYGKYRREVEAANKRAKAAADARAKAESDSIRLAERVRIINEALQAGAQQPPAPAANEPKNPFEEDDIDPTVDYAAAVAQLNRRNRFLFDQQQASTELTVADRDERDLKDTFVRDATAYAQQEPSFPDAYAFLKDSRLIEIAITEFDKDPRDPNQQFTAQEIERMVAIFNGEEKWVVNNAVKQGKSPSAAIMKLARARGFTVKAPAAPTPPKPGANGKAPAAPGARAPAAPAAPGKDVAAEIAQLAKNRDDGRSLSDGGSVPADGVTVELLLRMSDDEFADYVESIPQAKLDALMGRLPNGGA